MRKITLSPINTEPTEPPDELARARKVARISQQIARGEYKIDLDLLAQRIVDADAVGEDS